jgi:hypothetical protein
MSFSFVRIQYLVNHMSMKLSTCSTVFSYLQSFDTVSCEFDAHHVSLRQAVGTDGLPWCSGLPDRYIKFKGWWFTDALLLCSVGLNAISSALVCEDLLRCLDWHRPWPPGRRNRCSSLVFRWPDSNHPTSISLAVPISEQAACLVRSKSDSSIQDLPRIR